MQKPQLIDNRYELHQLLEQSDTTKIYSAFDTKLQRLVTLKILTQSNLSAKEAQAIAQLKHHNIVTVFDYGTNYIVMEHIAGQNLAKYCKTQQNLSIKWIVNTIQQIADALYHAHRENIIHRDLKPANIIICSGIPKITDFGQAKYLDETTSGEIVRGALPYMAPEQLQENPKIDQRTDIYAVGVIFYELLTKQNPFADVTLTNTNAIRKQVPPLPSRIDKSIPRYLQKICMKCLEKKKKRRYQSARTLARDLNKFANRTTLTWIYIPWLLFICLLGFNIYNYTPSKSQQKVTNRVHYLDYPIIQKYDEHVLAKVDHNSLSPQVYAKLLLYRAMSTLQVDERQEIIAKIIVVVEKAISANTEVTNITFLRFLYYLAHCISPHKSFRDKAATLLTTSTSPQHEIEYYNNATVLLRGSLDKLTLHKALTIVNAGIEISSSFVFLYEIKARIHLLMDEREEAMQCYKKALEYEPHNPFILGARAEYFYKTANYSAALEDIKTSLSYNITIAQTWYLHSRLLKLQQRYNEASKSITYALQLGYEEKKCYYQRQGLYKKQKKYHKALVDCNILLSLEKRAVYYEARAQVYIQLHQLQNAIKDLEKMYDLHPEDRKLILRMANIYKKLGNVSRAKDFLRKYTASQEQGVKNE